MNKISPQFCERLFGGGGAVIGALAVGAGAFAAHGLKGSLSADALANWETGARYALGHGLALVLVALLAGRHPGPPVMIAGLGFLAGVIVFSGSLFLLSLTGARWLGAITPIGGVCFIVGWLALAVGWLRR